MKAFDILLVEDNPGDVRLITHVLKKCNVPNQIHVVRDGVEALAFLRHEEPYAESAAPDLILLDLNLPRKDGREVLWDIKQDPHLRRIPVVILTTSSAERDIVAAYDLHANSYVTKPILLDELISLARSIEDFWLGSAKLPSGKNWRE